MSTTWTKASIVAQIKLLHSQGEKLNSGIVRKTQGKLYSSAYYHFGGWKKAVEAAGIDYQSVSIRTFSGPRKTWTKALVISEIKRLHKSGEDINVCAVNENHSKLYYAAGNYFGSWKKAVKKAGIDYRSVAKRPDFINWSKELVIKKMKQRKSAGKPVNSRAVEHDDFLLWSAGSRLFGGWRGVLRAISVDPSSVYLLKTWTRIDFCKEIETLQADGTDLSMVNMEHLGRQDLLNAARKLYGSWKDALEAQGLVYSDIRKGSIRNWDASLVRNEILSLALEGERLSHGWAKENHNGLTHAALKFFGSWEGALEAAGLNPKEHAKKWSMDSWLKNMSDEEYGRILRGTITREE